MATRSESVRLKRIRNRMHASRIIADPCGSGTLVVRTYRKYFLGPELPPPHDGNFSAIGSQPSLLFLDPPMHCCGSASEWKAWWMDQHQSQNSGAMKAKNGALGDRKRSHWRSWDPNRDAEAQNGAVEGLYYAGSRRYDHLMRIQIRNQNRNKGQGRFRIRIKVKRRIRNGINAMRIRNTSLPSFYTSSTFPFIATGGYRYRTVLVQSLDTAQWTNSASSSFFVSPGFTYHPPWALGFTNSHLIPGLRTTSVLFIGTPE